MSDFKGRHFEGETVLWAVRWYCRYGVSYRDLEQMMGERGVSVDHSAQSIAGFRVCAGDREAPALAMARAEIDQLARRRDVRESPRPMGLSLRAVDKFGNTIDFYLSPTRNTAAAKRFLGKTLNGLKGWEKPRVINTDKAPTYAARFRRAEAGGQMSRGDAASTDQIPE